MCVTVALSACSDSPGTMHELTTVMPPSRGIVVFVMCLKETMQGLHRADRGGGRGREHEMSLPKFPGSIVTYDFKCHVKKLHIDLVAGGHCCCYFGGGLLRGREMQFLSSPPLPLLVRGVNHLPCCRILYHK